MKRTYDFPQPIISFGLLMLALMFSQAAQASGRYATETRWSGYLEEIFTSFPLDSLTDTLLISLSSEATGCENGTDGLITVNITGGTPPYNVEVSPEVKRRTVYNTITLPGIVPGGYDVVVTDQMGLQAFGTVTVDTGLAPPIPDSLFLYQDLQGCLTECEAFIVFDRDSNYIFRWNGRLMASDTVRRVCGGDYTLQIERLDQSCIVNYIVEIPEPPIEEALPSCPGDTVIQISMDECSAVFDYAPENWADEACGLGKTHLATTDMIDDGYGLAGAMFDLENLTSDTIVITGWDLLIDEGAWDIQVYQTFLASSFVGNTTNGVNASNNIHWLFRGQATVSSEGTAEPTHLPIGNIILPPNKSYGFYITSTRDWIQGPISMQESYPGAEVGNCDIRLKAGIGLTNRAGIGFLQGQWDLVFGNTQFSGGNNPNYRLIEARIHYVPLSEAVYQIDGTGLSSLSTFPVGVTPQIFSFTNNPEGNEAVCSFNVSVAEPVPPTFTACPEDITVAASEAGCSAIVEYDLPTFTDNCLTRDLTLSLNQTDQITGQAQCFIQQTGESPTSSHLRIFDLQNHFLVSPFLLSQVEFGVANSDGTEEVMVNVYEIHPDSALVYGNLNLLQSQATTPPAGADFVHTVSVNASVQSDHNLVVEVVDPDNSAFIAGYTEGGNGISYFAGCGLDEPTDLKTVNCIERHFYVRVSGVSDLILTLEQTDSTGLSSGAAFPAGVSQLEYTATDASGNTALCSFSVTVATDLDAILTPASTSCSVNEGAITTEITGGLEPYTFAWSSGSADQNLVNLSPGLYTLALTDALGCSFTAEAIVEGDLAPTFTALSAMPSLCGQENGTATVSAEGLNAPLSFAWNTGASDTLLVDLAPGFYTVTVTDTAGCIAIDSVEVLEIPGPTIDSLASEVSFCGNNNGSVLVVPGGDSGPFTFAWNNGATDSLLTDLGPGLYTVTITDSNGCAAVDTIEVDEITGPDMVVFTTPPSLCGGVDGAAAVAPSGNGPFAYEWETGATDSLVTGLSAGTYLVTVTDANGCVSEQAVEVGELGGPDLNFSSILPGGCNTSDGAATVTPDGIAPFIYVWTTGSMDSTATGLLPGDYQVTVIDGNNCIAVGIATVDQPAGPDLVISTTLPSTCVESDGTADVAPSGTGPFSYEWSTGTTDSLITGLAAGVYSVTVTDGLACVSVGEATIEVFTNLAISNEIITDALCGEPTGSIEIGVTGGTWPYDFAWSSGASDSLLVNLSAGAYSVTVTDDLGCEAEATLMVTDPGVPQIDSINAFNAYCGQSSGSAEVFFSGGTGPYNVLWSNGVTEPAVTDLIPGEYAVVITDDNGCETAGLVIVDEDPGQKVSIAVLQQPTACVAEDGILEVQIAGGVSPYEIVWSTGSEDTTAENLSPGVYTVLVTDAEGCEVTAEAELIGLNGIDLDWSASAATCSNSNGSVLANFSGGEGPLEYVWSLNGNVLASDTADQTFLFFGGLQGAMYELQLFDSTGCATTAQIEVVQQTGPQILPGSMPATCGQENGTAWVEITGGTYPFSFVWENNQSDSLLTDVPAGIYAIAVLDDNGCISTGIVEVQDQPDPVVTAVEILPASCSLVNGAITLDVQAATPEYTIAWSNGDSTLVIDSLTAGYYSVVVTDANGCIASLDSLLIGEDPDGELPVFSVCPTDLVVHSCDSTIVYDLPEATDNCEVAIEQLEGLPSGAAFPTDTVLITYQAADPSGNSALCSFIIVRIEDLAAEALSQSVSCFGANDGELSLNVTGGTGPYQILWSTGDTMETISGLSPGLYTATITDQGACVTGATAEVTAPAAISIALDSIVAEAPPCENGAIFISPAGGTAPFTFVWTNLDEMEVAGETEDLEGVTGAAYECLITDANGCNQTSATFIVQQDPSCVVSTVELAGQAAAFNVFPNPTNGMVSILLQAPQPDACHFVLYDLRGLELARFSGQWLVEHGFELDLSAYPNGAYWLRMQTGTQLATRKLVLVR